MIHRRTVRSHKSSDPDFQKYRYFVNFTQKSVIVTEPSHGALQIPLPDKYNKYRGLFIGKFQG